MELPKVIENTAIQLADVEEVNRLLAQRIAMGTRRVYASDFKIFADWCAMRGFDPKEVSAEAVAIFIANEFEAGRHPNTINRRLAAIRFAYKSLHKTSPTEHELVRATLKGIKRDEKAPPIKRKTPLTNNVLIKIIQHVPHNNIRGIRDRAILLMLFGGAFRRSELINVQHEDLTFVEHGLDVVVRRSKTNQEGKHQMKSIAKGEIFCPILAVRSWLDISGVYDGHLFRALTRGNRVTAKRMCENSIYYMVKHYAARAGYDIDIFSPHSLRAGFTTSAVEKGKNIYKVMDVTLHASMNSLKPYIKFADRYKDHPGDGLL